MTLGVLLSSRAPLTRHLSALLVVLGAFAPVAHADTIVFTGHGQGPNFGWSLFEFQWLAGEFTVAEAYTVTSIEGWIVAEYIPGDVTVRLYSDGGDIPGTPLFADTIQIESTSAAWAGPTNLEWIISPGTYWAAFEPGSFSGLMPFPSPNPVPNEAVGSAAGYQAEDSLDFGLRIFGDPAGAAPIPEPSTLVLLGTAAVGVAGRAWRRSKQRR